MTKKRMRKRTIGRRRSADFSTLDFSRLKSFIASGVD
jgi:hypothetical protein